MEIPLPPSAPKQESDYSPSHVTSPHSDDEENSGNLSSKPPLNSSKKVLTKKRVTNILNSLKFATSKKATKITNFRSNQKDLSGEEREEKSADEVAEELRIEREKIKEKMAAFRERDMAQKKLNIESIIEEEQFERQKIMPKIDLMPNKAGSSFHQMRIAAGPVDIDLLNQQRAEQAAKRLAEANAAIVNKGPIVCDNFGFVTAKGREIPQVPHSPTPRGGDSYRKRRDRSRSRSPRWIILPLSRTYVSKIVA